MADKKTNERPYDEAKRSPKEDAKIENRQPDQIADYHKKHPTLKATTDAHEADPPTLFDTDTKK